MVFRTLHFQASSESGTSNLKTSGDKHAAEKTAASNGAKLTLRAFVAVLKDIHSRWARKPFSASTLWEIVATTAGGKDQARNYYDITVDPTGCLSEVKRRVGFGEQLFRSIPWTVKFYDRMMIIREWLDTERIRVQGGAAANNNMFFREEDVHAERSRGTVVRIRHSNLLADGITAMSRINGADIKDRIAVRYVNDFGVEEMVS